MVELRVLNVDGAVIARRALTAREMRATRPLWGDDTGRVVAGADINTSYGDPRAPFRVELERIPPKVRE